MSRFISTVSILCERTKRRRNFSDASSCPRKKAHPPACSYRVHNGRHDTSLLIPNLRMIWLVRPSSAAVLRRIDDQKQNPPFSVEPSPSRYKHTPIAVRTFGLPNDANAQDSVSWLRKAGQLLVTRKLIALVSTDSQHGVYQANGGSLAQAVPASTSNKSLVET